MIAQFNADGMCLANPDHVYECYIEVFGWMKPIRLYFKVHNEGYVWIISHFPIGGTGYDYRGLYVFNTVPSEDYKRACEDPKADTVDSVCDIIVSMALFDSFEKTFDEWFFDIPDEIEKGVSRANMTLQAVIDKGQL